jgi:hypothetical protein
MAWVYDDGEMGYFSQYWYTTDIQNISGDGFQSTNVTFAKNHLVNAFRKFIFGKHQKLADDVHYAPLQKNKWKSFW